MKRRKVAKQVRLDQDVIVADLTVEETVTREADGTEAEAIVAVSPEPEPVVAEDESPAVVAREPEVKRPRRRSAKAAAVEAPILEPSIPEPEAVEPEPDEPEVDAPQPGMRLIIDPEVSGGVIHGRFDTLLRGRIHSDDPIEEVVLLADGYEFGRIQYGVSTAHATTHGRPDDGWRAFQFHIPRILESATGPCECRLVAHTESGAFEEHRFALAITPNYPTKVRLVSGPAGSAHGLSVVLTPVVCYVERAACDDNGTLLLHGWAVSRSSVVAIQVFAGNTRIGAARLGTERGDVEAAFPAYPNGRSSGFLLNGHVPEADRGATHLRIETVCLRGISHSVLVPLERTADALPVMKLPEAAPAPTAPAPVAPAPSANFSLIDQTPSYQLTAAFRIQQGPMVGAGVVPPPPLMEAPAEPAAPAPIEAAPEVRRDIHMFCDFATLGADGRLEVVGWAVCAAGIARVAILLDDSLVGLAEIGHERPDVGEEYHAIPSARYSGFRFDRAVVDAIQGAHGVTIVVSNGANDEKTETIEVVAPIVEHVPEPVAEPAQEQADPNEFRFQLDAPATTDGVVAETITGRLTIEGWILARSGVASMEVYIDDQRLGEAHYGLARQDVGQAFPDWDNALRSGYAFHCPPRSLRDGEHEFRVTVRANNGQTHVQRFTATIKKAEDADDVATIRRRISRVEANLYDDVLRDVGYRPSFRLYLIQHGALDIARLNATFGALRTQVAQDWSLRILVEGADDALAMGLIVGECAADLTDRIAIVSGADAAWTASLADAADATTLIGVLSPGDELGCDALAELAVARGLRPAADFLYADEACRSPASREREAFFKPDFSPDLLMSRNYIGRPWLAEAGLIRATGVTPASLLSDGDYDLVLRCTEQARSVQHVSKLLCVSADQDLGHDATARLALAAAAVRRGFAAEVLETQVPNVWRVRRTAPASGKVSIIIPTCAAKGYIETCLTTLRENTAYKNYEIVVIDNIPENMPVWKIYVQQNADRVVEIPDAFNWSRFNNLAAAASDGDYLLFLNDDIEILQDDWLDILLESAARPEVGIVGPQLLYPDRKVQHAGMFLSSNGIGRHAFRFAAEDEPGYFGLALTQRNVIAVTGACMLVRREVFDSLGGFDEAHQIVNNDLDFCLRVHRAGLLTVFTPFASLIHHELASRDRLKDVFDLTHFNAAWKSLFTAGDPYFNPRLSRHADDYRPDDEGVQTVFAAHPLFEAADIRRILVVKLDHIGDFVTALPAIRRLKTLFPQSEITVLGGRASRAFADADPCIDAFIPFDFFHARSQLGERELTADDYNELLTQLAPYRFDLAVDLRKHLSTRDVLKFTGAKLLAGFDYMGQFPFLDIALEWDGDKTLQRKRGHVVDDLLALVGAIGSACETDRDIIQPPPTPMPLDDLAEPVRALFARPVVAVHLGAGNITKQWPEEHFAALVDLLIERSAVNVLLVGGPDEAELAASLVENVQHPESIASMVGQTSLADLPRLLAACVLYIGNDSGPKHIAAALGLATIGIHSGVVDATEWGPVGRRAVALRRNMTCSPCYLAKAEDCPRSLACLRLLEPSLVFQTAEFMLARPTAVELVEEVAELVEVVEVVEAEPKRKGRRGSARRDAAA